MGKWVAQLERTHIDQVRNYMHVVYYEYSEQGVNVCRFFFNRLKGPPSELAVYR